MSCPVRLRWLLGLGFALGLVPVAHADAPSGYRCGAGKAVAGKGCECPKGTTETRDPDDNATCVARVVAAPAAATPGLCDAVAEHLLRIWSHDKKLRPEKIAVARGRVRAMIVHRCSADKWSRETLTCFGPMTTDQDGERCLETLSKTQARRLDADADALGDPNESVVEIKADHIEFKQPVGFDGKAVAKASLIVLDDVAFELAKETDIAKLRIEVRTDNVGVAEFNLWLSQVRADAVRDYLIGKGVDATRLVAVGSGQDKPIAAKSTRDGRARNPRLEILVERKTVK